MVDPLSSLLSTTTRAQSATPAFLGDVQRTKPAVATPGDFSDMLTQMIGDTANTLREAEKTSIAGIQGKATVQEVVEAVMAADQSLQAAVAVRDKVTAAYLELSRMTI
ncbi:MAG: flagellar hook-basal body complex protein FliE [Alphaproteobacteria bacterium]